MHPPHSRPFRRFDEGPGVTRPRKPRKTLRRSPGQHLSRPLLLLLTAAAVVVQAATSESTVAPTNAATALDPFANEVVCRTRLFEIRRAELDRAIDQFTANASLRGQSIPPTQRAELEATILDRLVVTRLLLGRATEADRRQGRIQSTNFVATVIKQAGSETAFKRQLLALGFSRDDFEAQVLERAVCEEVVERELAPKVQISEDQLRSAYESRIDQFRRPEMVRVSHILFSTRDPKTGDELPAARLQERRREADKVLERARKGEDFAVLVQEHSDDAASKDKGGEYTFRRGEMVTEFEQAAFSLATNQVSDIVTTRYGYHIIKLLQQIPPETIELDQARDELHRGLVQKEVQTRLLPPFLRQLKAEAKIEYLNGARAPTEPVTQEPTTKADPSQ